MPKREVRVDAAASPNISKYAKANDVWISLARHGNNMRLTVRDNGVGFDTAAPQSQRYGLVGMGFRAEADQGRLRVRSKPDSTNCTLSYKTVATSPTTSVVAGLWPRGLSHCTLLSAVHRACRHSFPQPLKEQP